MDEAQHIVVDALERAGIVLPPGIAAVPDFGPAALVSVCSQALGLIHGDAYDEIYLPGFVPKSISVRFKVCTRLAEQVKQLGYRDDLSFHQFLYPNEADVHRLLRFLLDKVSKVSSAPSTSSRRLPQLVTVQRSQVKKYEDHSDHHTDDSEAVLRLQKELHELQEKITQIEVDENEASELVKLYDEETEKLQLAEDELSLLQEAMSLITKKSSAEEALQLLKERLDTAQKEWNDDEEVEKLVKNIKTRRKDLALLTSQLERCPKQASRSSYIRRITELVKNSKKQDADVTKIIAETRTLQRDNNASQERLRRIHVLVDELIFRDAKKDPQCRLAYRLLTSMHQNFADLVDKVFEMDKLEREIADLLSNLETLQKAPVDIARVQADLNAILLESSGESPLLQKSPDSRASRKHGLESLKP